MKKRRGKQIAAIVCIVILVLLYIGTFISSFLDFPGSDRLFMAALAATVAVPILLWIYIWLYGIMTQKHTIASFDADGNSDKDAKKDADNHDSTTASSDHNK